VTVERSAGGQTRIHCGCERVLVMLRREGWRDNLKRVHRTYKEAGRVAFVATIWGKGF